MKQYLCFLYAVLLSLPAISNLPFNWNKQFFNPKNKETVILSADLRENKTLTIKLLGADGRQVRELCKEQSYKKGRQTWIWDGKDDKGNIVPDEAYCLLITEGSGKKAKKIFDAIGENRGSSVEVKDYTYNRAMGYITYTLPSASRISVWAMTDSSWPLLRVIADMEPRLSGEVIERWRGLDESGNLNLLKLFKPSFSIRGYTLPEASIITIGNKDLSYSDYCSAMSSEIISQQRKNPESSILFHKSYVEQKAIGFNCRLEGNNLDIYLKKQFLPLLKKRHFGAMVYYGNEQILKIEKLPEYKAKWQIPLPAEKLKQKGALIVVLGTDDDQYGTYALLWGEDKSGG